MPIATGPTIARMRIAFATCSALPDGDADDRLAARALGATFEVWDDPPVDWEVYDRVVLRSTWDYTLHLDAFLRWCAGGRARRLRNGPELVAFNADKRYLADLPVATVPTTFVVAGDAPPALHGEVVVKPSVGAGARDTGASAPAAHGEALALVDRITASGCAAMVQPYLAGRRRARRERARVLPRRAVARAVASAPSCGRTRSRRSTPTAGSARRS